MKTLLIAILSLGVCSSSHAQFGIGGKIQDHVNNQINNSIDQSIEGNKDKDENSSNQTETPITTTQTTPQDTAPKQTPNPQIKMYANYDFVPGEQIIFDDNMTDSKDGEFPPHWDLKAGQGVINKMADGPAFLLTDGNYCIVNPRMKTENYLSNNFTVEWDNYMTDGSGGTILFFNHDGEGYGEISTNTETVIYTTEGMILTGSMPEEMKYDNYYNKWHHYALGVKDGQLKIYVDQYRILVVPNMKITPLNLSFGGVGDPTYPITFKNVRIALGGNQNMLDKIISDGKFTTHAITFDVNKSTIKPESMGFINELSKWLHDNPTIKLEIDGHTDSDGEATGNQKLSEARAQSVKDQLVSMGVSADRLTTKGFGEEKPIDNNTTPEGKSNNRRVEFVVIK